MMQVAVGTVVAFPSNTADGSEPLPHHIAQALAGQRLESAFTIGKELFLVFEEKTERTESQTALRLHFGMNGSLNIRKASNKTSGVAPWKQNKPVSLRLYFSDASSQSTILEVWESTVNYPVSVEKARNKLVNLSSKDACSIHFNAQDVFTSLRQDGHSLSISDAILHQEIFPGVGNIIKIESLHRSQVDPRRKVGGLSDAELRRIVKHARMFSMEWLNIGRAGEKKVYNQTVCGTCRGMTVKMQKIGGSDEGTSGKSGWMSRVTFWCTHCQPASSSASASNHNPLSVQPSTTNKENPTHQPSVQPATSINPAAPNHATHPSVQCPQHGTKSIKLCRVRNSSKQNTLRIFFTCKSRGCQFFSWADKQFPQCKCNSKTVLRVSKTANSGGRWFLCCAKGDRSARSSVGCGHFEWAKTEYLAPLGSFLSPLL